MKLKQIRNKLKRMELEHVQRALDTNGWNQARTAKDLGCYMTTLRRIMERHPQIMETLKERGLPRGNPTWPRGKRSKQG